MNHGRNIFQYLVSWSLHIYKQFKILKSWQFHEYEPFYSIKKINKNLTIIFCKFFLFFKKNYKTPLFPI